MAQIYFLPRNRTRCHLSRQSRRFISRRYTFQQGLIRRHPQLAALPPGEQVAALAALSGRSHAAIAAALHQAATTPHSFTQALYTLQRLERSL